MWQGHTPRLSTNLFFKITIPIVDVNMEVIWIALSLKIILCINTCFKGKPSLKLTQIFVLFLGIRKLINNGSYIAAFPPHEVILKDIFHSTKQNIFILGDSISYFLLLWSNTTTSNLWKKSLFGLRFLGIRVHDQAPWQQAARMVARATQQELTSWAVRTKQG